MHVLCADIGQDHLMADVSASVVRCRRCGYAPSDRGDLVARVWDMVGVRPAEGAVPRRVLGSAP